MKSRRSYVLSAYFMLALLSVLNPEPIIAQSTVPQSLSDIERLEKRISVVEDTIQKQVQGMTTMVQLSTIVFATVSGGFALFGVGSYLGLVKEIREKFTKQLDELQKMKQDLATRLKDSDKLRQQVEDLVQIQSEQAPASLIARAREVFQQEIPNPSDGANYLSQLARLETASSDDLFSGAIIAKQYLRNRNKDHSSADITLLKRKRRLDEKAILDAYNNSRRNFAQEELSNLNLSKAKLLGVNFFQCKLTGTNLQGADLSNADLGRANLSQAILKNTNLNNAYLGYADLEESDLRGANLIGANLRYAHLKNANLCGANLSDAQVNPEQIALAKTNWLTVMPNGKRACW